MIPQDETNLRTNMLLTPPTLARYTVGLLIAVAVAFLMWYFRSIVVYILVSALLAIIFKPLVGRLARLRIRGWHLPRWAAALATLILIWVLFVVACTLFVPLVFDKLYQFATLDFGSVLRSVEEPIARMQEYLHDLFALPDERFSLTDSLIQWFKSIFDYDTINTAFSSIVSLTLSAVIAFFSISFITFFFLKDDELFLSMLKAPFPERVHGNIERAMSSVSQLLMRYFTGILSESCILMIVISVTMIFFALRRPAHRRRDVGLHGRGDADRGDDHRAHDVRYRRIAAHHQGVRRLRAATHALFGTGEGASARNIHRYPDRRIIGGNRGNAAGDPVVHRAARLRQGVLLAVPAGTETHGENLNRMIIEGIVVHGNSLGGRMGFPTANIEADASLDARDGVYASRVEVDGRMYDAMSNLGYKPTVDGRRRLLETNIFGFEGDLYGRRLRVELLRFIRPERRFGSVEELFRQIGDDRREVCGGGGEPLDPR